MKKLFNFLLVALFLSFFPRCAFACVGGENSDLPMEDIIITVIVAYVFIFGIIYFKTYKKLLEGKWGILQYVILIPAIIPAVLFSIFLFFGLTGVIFEYFLGTSYLGKFFFLPVVLGLLVGTMPLILRRKWMYTLVVPIYSFLSLIIIGLMLINALLNTLCGGSVAF